MQGVKDEGWTVHFLGIEPFLLLLLLLLLCDLHIVVVQSLTHMHHAHTIIHHPNAGQRTQ